MDSKIRNHATITIQQEDHTIGNIIRMQLLKDPRVRFSGYRKPHPLENKVEIKVQTNGEINPATAVEQVCTNTHEHMALNAYRMDQNYQNQHGSTLGRTMGGPSSYMTHGYSQM
ncbi:dna-directed rna polymerase ii subunit rpb11-like isoform x1 [Stylonychia lemnae]|uniref:Dna-directed rna polymerase ii subunit rpb11-like isoform x1 n=1 Tax=Stylonychia lemnae TaxID=5949 RepID=A0A078AXY2_STYLE|nr:dna-directed rna polymerase ii subunit rpb11-like isoform x1 [Stylonychia lemnae]|eukprot:CDW87300.1 dna-directed rna polymerase ii subunit rpb11-like isoform x1 [Stylonychia lemnae]